MLAVDTSNSIPEGGFRTGPWKTTLNPKPGSIRTVPYLLDYIRKELKPATEENDSSVGAVVRGAIDRTKLNVDDLSIVNPEWRGAYFHEHDFDVAMIPEQVGIASTLTATKDVVVYTLQTLLEDKKWSSLLGNLAKQDTDGKLLEVLLSKLQTARGATTIKQELQTAWQAAFSEFRNFIGYVFSPRIYPLLRKHQQAIGPSAREMDWTNFDIGFLRNGEPHARDIRSSYSRKKGGGLRIIKFRRG